jgi:very-short-patch-repair endonuclease
MKKSRLTKPTKNELVEMLDKMSQNQIAKKYKISRNTIAKWMKDYQIDSTYFKGLKTSTIKYKIQNGNSPLDIAEEFGVHVKLVLERMNRHRIKIPMWDMSWQFIQTTCKMIINQYPDNQGLVKKLQQGDPNTYNNIMRHTETHILTTDKFTERVYRLAHDVPPSEVFTCCKCDTPLKFYTLKLGYGNSDKMVCRAHNQTFANRVSKASNELFETLIKKHNHDEIYYHAHNHEFRINVRYDRYQKEYPGINKEAYYLDFYDAKQKKNIEFDGTYWHKNTQNKDELRDRFLASERGIQIHRVKEEDYRNNPEKVIEECLKFLKTTNNTK